MTLTGSGYSVLLRNKGAGDNLPLRIGVTLEAPGVPHDPYRLHDTIDVEALPRFLASADGDVVVRVTVQGLRLEITPETVRVVEQA